MILSLLEGPNRKKHINSCCFLMIRNLPPDPPDQVSFATVRDLPSTRAGGQDDVSSKQTPSNYFFTYMVIWAHTSPYGPIRAHNKGPHGPMGPYRARIMPIWAI